MTIRTLRGAMKHGTSNAFRAVGTVVLILIVVLIAPITAVGQPATPSMTPTQPGQPERGPGGSDYPYTDVDRTHVGEAPGDAWVFTPRGADLASDEPIDVVIMVHGFMAVDPEMYIDWINHLVRHGAVVIFPVFQTVDLADVPPATWPVNMFSGVKAAIIDLEDKHGLDVSTSPIAVIGHSLGGPLAIRYALDAGRLGFPEPRTLFIVQPGGCKPCGNFGGYGIALPLDARLPASLYVQVLVGDRDETVGDADARALWPMFDAIPDTQKDYITIRSDEHGTPAVIADHTALGTGNRPDGIDVIDWLALWRAHDALTACVDGGEFCEYALGDTPEHRSMGVWSDGTPIIPLLITEGPPA